MSDDRHEAVSRRAYELWEKDGSVHGRHEDHWHQAASEVGGTDVAPDGTTFEGTPADQTPLDAPVAPPAGGSSGTDAAPATPADQTPADGPVAPPVKTRAAARPRKPKATK